MINQDQTRPDVFHNRVFNDDMIKGRWKEVKGGVRALWGELTDDELEETKGDLTSIAGLIQRKYGESKKSVQEKLDNVFRSFYDREAGGDLDEDLDYDTDEDEDYPRAERAEDAANRNNRERQL